MGTQPRLAHVVFQTSQPEAMTDWYCTVLKAHVVHAGHGLTFMTFDEEHHRIALLAMPAEVGERKSPTTASMHHTAWTFDSLDALLERYQDLADQGVQPAVPTEYMRGDEYGNEPVGPSFDVHRMIEALRDGVPVAELTTRSWALAGPTLPDPLPILMGAPA